jgi:GntR family transcriptional regulator
MIENGELKPGDQLWTEEEIERFFNVSRTTVRTALRELANEGYVVIQQGKRTFISKPKVTRGFPGLTSFTEDMTKRGLKPGAELISCNVLIPTADIANKLRLEEDKKIILLKRRMFAEDEIIGFHIVHLPYDVWTNLKIEPSYLDNRSLYQTLEEKGGYVLAEAEETIEVGYADSEIGKVLHIKKGDPVLIMNRLVYTTENLPIECAINIYRVDRYKYEIHHRRQKPTS